MANPLRKWMRAEDIYDKDLEALLEENGVKDPKEDFKNITQKQWDEIVRKGKVERFKELKDQSARNRLEKKIKKIEKVWRSQSGIKSTSIKKGGSKKEKKETGTDAEKKKKDALSSNQKLKKDMQEEGFWELELFLILCDKGIKSKKDCKSVITSNDDFDEIYRLVRVARSKDLKDNDAKLRMEKLMTKFEKFWRKESGIKKTSVTKKTGTGDGKKKNPKEKKADELTGKGAKLKNWMRKNEIWEQSLYQEFLSNGIEDPDALAQLSEENFDNIIRTVRVERFKELKDQKSRQRCDDLLIKFEKQWRKESGIKKTSIKDEK